MATVPSWRLRSIYRKLAMFLANLILAVAALFPILWGLSSSLKPSEQIVEFPPRLLPKDITFEHYLRIVADNAMFYLFNSAFISVAAVLLALLTGALAAYALARFEFRGRSTTMVC